MSRDSFEVIKGSKLEKLLSEGHQVEKANGKIKILRNPWETQSILKWWLITSLTTLATQILEYFPDFGDKYDASMFEKEL